MIVKVTLRDSGRVALVHDKNRDHIEHKALAPAVMEILAGRREAFFTADLRDNNIVLIAEAVSPGWT